MRRALTWLETLLAMSLLSALALAAAGWIGAAARFSQSALRAAPWEAGGTAVLALVHDDLRCGDFDPREREPRVVAREGVLHIRTRAVIDGRARRIIRTYRLGPGGALVAEDRPADRPDSGPLTARPLLGGVSQWRCEFDEKARRLTVSVADAAGREMRRRYVVR
jgi:hypothetical protein